ncbi:MAG: ABC transporter ATP-binding protein [Candidatus Hydrothermarchaeota archaeon]|nr:MAG: ABC transporter ATP-binding protein [Candidatus Hydrothermarchaeota archaeon]
MIRAESISMIYKDGTIALEGVSFSIAKGESCSVIGPSGCGKTTLLFILSRLLKPTEGEILINSKNIALILQDYGLFPWKTVYENVSLGLEVRGVKKEEQRKIVLPLLEKLGLKGFENHYPRQLSGGMQQRVAFARALALSPEILLMDEPFSSLDALTREKLQNFLLKLWINNKVTMVLVTHSIEEAVFLGRKIVVLSQRPGRVLKIIDNPEMGSLDYRNREEFFEKCREVRKSIEEKDI